MTTNADVAIGRGNGAKGRTPILAANWKMHHTASAARRFAEELPAALAAGGGSEGSGPPPEVVICPPFTGLSVLSEALSVLRGTVFGSSVALGAQDVHWEDAGAFTGEISPAMLLDWGCRYVVVGHSERRTLFGESDDDVRRKVEAVLTHDMVPILCVGESAEQRDAGETERVIASQVEAAIESLSAADVGRLVIAYEPIWAIGTGVHATAEDADRAIGAVRAVIGDAKGDGAAGSVRIQYGGSVKPSNIQEFCVKPEIDGALVGGASLEAASFAAIVRGWR